MNKSLFQIEKEYLDIAQQLTEGEITLELENALMINEKELQNKSVNYCFVIKQMEADCDTIDNEIKRLQGLKKVRENAAERLKKSIKNAMLIYNVEEIKTALIKINFRKSESVEIVNESQLSEEYTTTKTTTTPNKTAIKDAIKAGVDVEGAVLVINQNIQIK